MTEPKYVIHGKSVCSQLSSNQYSSFKYYIRCGFSVEEAFEYAQTYRKKYKFKYKNQLVVDILPVNKYQRYLYAIHSLNKTPEEAYEYVTSEKNHRPKKYNTKDKYKFVIDGKSVFSLLGQDKTKYAMFYRLYYVKCYSVEEAYKQVIFYFDKLKGKRRKYHKYKINGVSVRNLLSKRKDYEKFLYLIDHKYYTPEQAYKEIMKEYYYNNKEEFLKFINENYLKRIEEESEEQQ